MNLKEIRQKRAMLSSQVFGLEVTLDEGKYAAKIKAESDYREAHKADYDRLVQLNKELKRVEEQIEDLVIETSLKSNNHPFPNGAKVYYDKVKGWSGKKNRIFGIAEIWTRESLCTDSKICTPGYGGMVIRLLKSDGSPSKRFDRYVHCWTLLDESEKS